jgi:hypothetical protein
LPLVPIAAFLAGALLSLLLPALMLTALVVWYAVFIRRAPGPADGSEPATPTTHATPASDPAESAATEAAPSPKEV